MLRMECIMTDPVEVTEKTEVPVEETPVEETPTDPAEPKAEEDKKEEPEQKEEDQPKKTHDQRRWERLLKERAEYKAKVELYEQMQLQQQHKPVNSGRPSRDKFDSDEDYVSALTSWTVEQKLGNVKQELAQHQVQNQTQAEWASKINQARADYADYDSVMEDAQDIPIAPVVAEAIQSSDLGGDIAYYLGKNPDEALRLNSMSPVAASREIGRIESYLEYEKSQAKAKKVPVSKAPNPIKPVKSSAGSGAKSLEDMSPSEYMAYMNKREAERRKRRF